MTTVPDFVYVTYIATAPETVWQALVDPEVTRRYWAGEKSEGPPHMNISDWAQGSRWEHRRADGSNTVDLVGTVLETDPPRRLVLSWGRPADADDETKQSRVTFEIEPMGSGTVRLTVIHDDVQKDPKMLAGITKGWPQVLSNLKTLLETGRPLPGSASEE